MKRLSFRLHCTFKRIILLRTPNVKPPLLTLLLSFFPTNSPLALSLLYFFTTPVRAMVKTKRDTTKVHTSKGHQWPVMSGETLASRFYHDTQRKMRWIRLQKWTNDFKLPVKFCGAKMGTLILIRKARGGIFLVRPESVSDWNIPWSNGSILDIWGWLWEKNDRAQ